MTEEPFTVNFKTTTHETPGDCIAWFCRLLEMPNLEGFSRPSDARGWRFSHWAAFAEHWGFDILSDRQHCHLISHPILGVLGSFSKTPGDQCSHINAMSELRLKVNASIRHLANVFFTIQSNIDILPTPSVMEFSSKKEFVDWLEEGSAINEVGLCSLICINDKEVEKFISVVRRLEHKFKVHPRHQFNKILKMSTKDADAMLMLYNALCRNENGETKDIFSAIVQYGMVDLLEIELVRLEEEKQAKRSRKKQQRKEKTKEKTINDIIWEKVNVTQRQMTELIESAMTNIQEELQKMSKELVDRASEAIKGIPKDPRIDQMEQEILVMKKDIVVTLKENHFLCNMINELGVDNEEIRRRFEKIITDEHDEEDGESQSTEVCP